MTREERHIAVLNRLLENMDVYDSIQPTEERKKAIKAAIQALSQEPCTDTVSIRKDALKTRVGNIVAYNVEWLKKHWQMEMDIVCGVKPCTNVVSREAVIYYIKGHIHEIITESGTDKNAHTNSILRALINGVETMPSATQKSGKWIPVSKRLPEVGISVLVSDADSDIYFTHITRDGVFFDEWGNKIKGIVAWMPLPKPYEPQESEEQTE